MTTVVMRVPTFSNLRSTVRCTAQANAAVRAIVPTALSTRLAVTNQPVGRKPRQLSQSALTASGRALPRTSPSKSAAATTASSTCARLSTPDDRYTTAMPTRANRMGPSMGMAAGRAGRTPAR